MKHKRVYSNLVWSNDPKYNETMLSPALRRALGYETTGSGIPDPVPVKKKRMSRNERVRAQRERMWAENARCHWCQQLTVLPPRNPRHGTKPARNEATIDHLDSRLSPERGTKQGERRHVLACWECNQRRSREEDAALPIEERRRRSGRLGLQQQSGGWID